MEAHHDVTGIALVALAALACGIAFARLRQPAIVGYILAGVLLGPSVFGLVENRGNVQILAELGIIMLLYVIGMELSVKRFAEVWRVAMLATVLQISGSVGLMLLVHQWAGWSLGTSVLLGYVVALSSTAVVIKLLEGMDELQKPVGRLTVGILIAQDMAVVPMMISLNALGDAGFSVIEGAKVAASIVVLALIVLILLRREIKIPYGQIVSGHADLGPLAGLAYCFGAASLSGLMGLSPGFGAFLMGLIVGNSSQGHRLLKHAHSIQAILLMVFFLSVGLLLDLRFLWDNLGKALLLLLAVIVFKTALNIGALRVQKVPWAEAFLTGVALAQIGEFSFVLAGAGLASGLLGEEEGQLVVAVTVLSLVVSPLWLASARRLRANGGASGSLHEVLVKIAGPEAERIEDAVRLVRSRLHGRLPSLRRARKTEIATKAPETPPDA